MTISLATRGVISNSTYVLFLREPLIADILSCSEVPLTQCGRPLELLRRKSVTLDILIRSNGVRMPKVVLDAALEIVFGFKIQKNDADINAVLIKYRSFGEIIVLPDGSEESPNVRISLSPDDMDLDNGAYFVGLDVLFTLEDVKEAQLQFNSCYFDTVNVNKDVIHFDVPPISGLRITEENNPRFTEEDEPRTIEDEE